jgi:hypothetical protein
LYCARATADEALSRALGEVLRRLFPLVDVELLPIEDWSVVNRIKPLQANEWVIFDHF